MRCRGPVLLASLSVLVVPLGATHAQVVRDSGGIQVVENQRPLLGPARAWRIDPKPILTIGGDPADPDTLNELHLVMGITRLSDGRWAVGVQASHTVRFYDARGRFVAAAGRRGQGPGEFRQVMGVRAIHGDTLVVTDLGEVEVFGPDGKFIRQGASRARGDRFIYPEAVLPDGSYLGQQWPAPSRAAPPAGRSRRTLPLVRVSRDGQQVDTLGTVSGTEEVFDGRQPFGNQVAFSGYAAIAGDASRVFVTSPERFEIKESALNGKVTRVIRLMQRRTKVSDASRAAYRDWFTSMPGEDGRPMPAAMQQRRQQMLTETEWSDEFPPFGRLIIDRAGNLWAQRYDYHSAFFTAGPVRTQTMSVPSVWDVFDRSGRWTTAVDLPANFTPVEIGADYVAGLGRDPDGVEQVRVYRLFKPN